MSRISAAKQIFVDILFFVCQEKGKLSAWNSFKNAISKIRPILQAHLRYCGHARLRRHNHQAVSVHG
jgi:hypothetical protein